jgi:hypothetical protein
MMNPMVNKWGHLGGFLTGFFIMVVLKEPYQLGDGACCSYKTWYLISTSLTSAFTLIGFSLFYLLDYYKF